MKSDTRMIIILSVFALSLACPGSSRAADKVPPADTFLKEAAEEEHGEIVLGQLAMGRASDAEVKRYGEQMLVDHTVGYQELQQMASEKGIQLPSEPSKEKKEKEQELSQLTGREFDRAYMSYMVRDHLKDIEEFEEGAKILKDPAARIWALASLLTLKKHLEMAKTIASSLGVDPSKLSKLEK